jgi:hypothetical protein
LKAFAQAARQLPKWRECRFLGKLQASGEQPGECGKRLAHPLALQRAAPIARHAELPDGWKPAETAKREQASLEPASKGAALCRCQQI